MGIVRVDAKPTELVEIVGRAPAYANDHAALADIVDQCDLLGEPDGVVQGHLGHGEPNLDLLGACGDGCGEGCWVHVGAAPVEMVLCQPDHVVAKFFGQFCLPEGFFNDVIVAVRRLALRE